MHLSHRMYSTRSETEYKLWALGDYDVSMLVVGCNLHAILARARMWGTRSTLRARDTRRVSALLVFAAKLKSLIKIKTPDFNEKPRQKHAVYLKNSLLSTYGVYILEKEFKKKKMKEKLINCIYNQTKKI